MALSSKVWVVRAGSTLDTPCTLALEASELVLTSEETEERIPLLAVRAVRRVHGSPVIVLRLEGEGLPPRVLVYFAQPPPLPTDQSIGRRKARRRNLSYFGSRNVTRRNDVREWVRAIRTGAGLGRRRR